MKIARSGLLFLTSFCSLSCAAVPLRAQRPNSGHFDAQERALLKAAQSGDAALFKYLSAGPGQMSDAAENGTTFLQWALARGKKSIFLLLLFNPGKPADPFVRNAQKSTFQRYLFMTDDRLLNKQTRAGYKAVLNYLLVKGIPIDPSVAPRHERNFKLR